MNFLPGQTATVTATCLTGDVVIGHYEFGQQMNLMSNGMVNTFPIFASQVSQGWSATGQSTGTSPTFLEVVAVCLKLH